MMVMHYILQSSFILLFTFNCASAATNPNCPAGWLSDSALNNKCYKPYATPMMTWMDAEYQCRTDSNGNGHLASIHNAFENNYLLGIAHDKGFQGKSMWIGLENFNDSSYKNYEWIDGSRLDYTNWIAGQPITYSVFAVLMITVDEDGNLSKWVATYVNHFDYINPFICQISH